MRTKPPATRRPLIAIGSTEAPTAVAPPLGVDEADGRALLETMDAPAAEPVEAACVPDAAAVALGALDVGPPDALTMFWPAHVSRAAGNDCTHGASRRCTGTARRRRR